MIRRAATASAFETYADFTYHNAVTTSLLERRRANALVPRRFVRAKAKATEAILREIAEQSEFNSRVYDLFLSYRQAASRYAEVSDLAQHQARKLVLG